MGIRYEWNLPNFNEEKIKELAKNYNLSDIVAKILYARNIVEHDDILNYLVGDYDEGYDPFLMNDMEKAVFRINQAIENEEKILIYGDYDADGITSTVLMLETLESLGANVSFYIPNRFTEGYGPNINAFTAIIESGVSLIITVDNGIAATEEIEFAQSNQCDVILTDHHKIQDTIPNAYAVIHPKHPESNYPYGELAGVGVAFKLAHALLGIYPEFLLDLVAIGTVADMVPMISENRIFVKQGLKLLNEDTRIGLKYILQKANHKNLIDEQTIGFTLAPRLNSIGRMNSAKEGVELLSIEDDDIAITMVDKIENYNIERKLITEKISNDAISKIEEKENTPTIFVYSDEYHEGVLGIVASNLVEKYKKPVLVAKKEEEKLKGSARSYGTFNIYSAMNEIKDKFIAFGGHNSAAGFSVEIQNVDILSEQMNKLYELHLSSTEEKIKKDIDLVIDFENISYQLLTELSKLKPFGNSFENINILSKNVRVLSKENFGSDKQYMKLQLGNIENSIEAISFKDNDVFNEIQKGDVIEIMFTLSKNYFNGRQKLQLQIIDINKNKLLFKDLRDSAVDFNTLPQHELKISKNYSDITNNYYTYNELHQISSRFDVINILEAPIHIDKMQDVLKLNAKSINILCDKNSATYIRYKIDKTKLIKLFNILLKYNELKIDDKKTLYTLLKTLDTNLESFKIMLTILQELNLCSIDKNIIVFNSAYEKIDLELSNTYVTMNSRFYIEKILLEEHIVVINQIFENMKTK